MCKDRDYKKESEYNNSNKPKLKISMFYVNTNLFHNYVQRFVITNLYVIQCNCCHIKGDRSGVSASDNKTVTIWIVRSTQHVVSLKFSHQK